MIFIYSTKKPVLARIIGYSERGDGYCRITNRRGDMEVQHDFAPVDRLSLACAPHRSARVTPPPPF